MGVGDRFDTSDPDSPMPARGNGGRRGKGRKVASRKAVGAASTLTDEPRPSDRYPDRTDDRDQTLRALLDGLRELEEGNFDVRLTPNGDPLLAEVVTAFNQVAARKEAMVDEITRVSTAVGREGRMNERASLPNARGGWARQISALNSLIIDLMAPTTEVARVIEAVAKGDLSQKMVLELDGKTVQGEFLRIGTTVNRMVDQLSAFAAEVTRVAREVGTEGRLGGQANVPGVGGTWKDLTDNVNVLAANLTNQVRNITVVTTAVANGDLSQKITVEA